MAPLLALMVLGGVPVLAVGVLGRVRSGRVRRASSAPEGLTAADLGFADGGAELGTQATMVQVSTAICARCPAAPASRPRSPRCCWRRRCSSP